MLNPADYRCSEASTLSREKYIPCCRQATCFVKNRDPKAYPMCQQCAWHNCNNRGAKIVEPESEEQIATIENILESLA